MQNAISIPDTLKAYKTHEKDLPLLPTTEEGEILSTLEPRLGVTGSIVLKSVVINGISKKYDGKFSGDKKVGEVRERTLYTGVITPEIAQEPEELRNTYLADAMKLGFSIDEMPFEKWLLEWGIKAAAQDLAGAIFPAKKSDADKTITGAFDGFEAIIANDISAGLISVANKNLYDAGGLFTVANVGDKLLNMYRTASQKFKKAKVIEVRISTDLYEMYEDWYKASHDRTPNIDTSGQVTLEGTQGKAKFVICPDLPAQRVIMTIPRNMVYGTENLENLKKILPFPSGNPHLYTATGKYNFGVQFRDIHESIFRTNKVY